MSTINMEKQTLFTKYSILFILGFPLCWWIFIIWLDCQLFHNSSMHKHYRLSFFIRHTETSHIIFLIIFSPTLCVRVLHVQWYPERQSVFRGNTSAWLISFCIESNSDMLIYCTSFIGHNVSIIIDLHVAKELAISHAFLFDLHTNLLHQSNFVSLWLLFLISYFDIPAFCTVAIQHSSHMLWHASKVFVQAEKHVLS